MRNRRLLHPQNQSPIFGEISDLKGPKGFRQPGGIIVLKRGKHFGLHSGYGAEHIWAEHKTDMAQAGFHSLEDVPAYVARIILPGTPVHCEFSGLGEYQHVTVIRSMRGIAVLAYMDIPDPHYSVVTAYYSRKKHGPRVGTVL